MGLKERKVMAPAWLGPGGMGAGRVVVGRGQRCVCEEQ